MARAAREPLLTPGAVLAEGWVGAVAVLALLKAVGRISLVADFACSPARLLDGELWTLATSSVVVQGPPVGQLVMTAGFAAWVIAALGARRFWIVALAGHVGATVLAYLGIAALWAIGGDHVADVVHEPDYGISAVWAALLGAVMVLGWRVGGRRRRIAEVGGAAILVALAALVGTDGQLADVEHLLAFAIGVAVTWGLTKRPDALHLALREAD